MSPKPAALFLYMYIAWLGFLDGVAGSAFAATTPGSR